MIELDLFYARSSAAIRAVQANYLKKQKSVPFPQVLPTVKEVSANEFAKMKFFQKLAYKRYLTRQKKAYRKALRAQKQPVDERLTRGFNAGIESALSVLASEFSAYSKQLEKEDKI